jgi:pseudouridine synthase
LPRTKTLERILSKAGVGSRTEARAWIAAGRVRVDGRVVGDPDTWLEPERARVTLDGRPVRAAAPVYLLLHKPTGYLTTRRDPQGRRTIYDLLPPEQRKLVPVGRLDLDSSGLLLLTNDTAFAERVTNPDSKVPKTYEVKAVGHLSDAQLLALARGVELRDGPTRPAAVRRLREPGGRTVLEITLSEGRNRQVRRMLEAVGSKVSTLRRVAIGALALGDLPPGAARPLRPAEVRDLLAQGSATR